MPVDPADDDDSVPRDAGADEDADPIVDDPDDVLAAGPLARITETVRVPDTMAGLRLDQGLARLLPSHSRARLQRWVRSGAVSVNGAAARPRDRLLGGEVIAVDAQVEAEERWIAQPVAFGVIHADDDLIIVDKPAGLVVHPGAGNADGTLVNGLLHRFPELAGVPRAGIVHRLDKDTSGLLAVARTLAAHAALVRQLADRSMGREYLAVTEGVPTAGFTVDAPIGRDTRNRLRMAVTGTGRPAVTHVRVLSRYRTHALLGCRLETGRTHQIRVHLRHMGFPIVGDALYGARGRLPPAPSAVLLETIRSFRRQALHARALGLRHPGDGRGLRFESAPPEDFAALVDALAADADGQRARAGEFE